MTVMMSLQEHFLNLAASKNILDSEKLASSSPKRKIFSDHGESPSKKQRIRTAKNFWSDIDKKLNLENISSGRKTLEGNLDSESSTKESENAGYELAWE